MNFTFLGTSAANAFPEAFCSCHNCQAARSEGGKSLRKRSAALVNDDLLIDLGPDIMTASQQHQIDLTNVQFCIQTHPHADHLDFSHLLSRSPGFGVVGAPRLHFYASSATLERASQSFKRDLSDLDLFSAEAETDLNVSIHEITPLEPFEIGPYRIIAFQANHAFGTEALLYSVESGGKCVFYGTDTAILFDHTWKAFHDFRLEFDIVVLDHTYGAHQLVEHVSRMKEEELLTAEGRVYATHIAHEGNSSHKELSKFASSHGYEIAYDGLELSI
jgi:phosphoribosyl 1,2-cyclic phosphate phosphodiesterase